MNEVKKEKVAYEVPEIISYTGDEIIDEIIVAQGCSPSPCPTPAFF
ncbi:hypothetical protein JXQ70_13280 [bacterium]|nr:hypothetical protein [bacterium]